ncbi:MAG TPA: ABC transporter permease subunit [Thermomicrobiales bacterium]|nr:ABC transporter permease subunit [Thermomicrobiales bacterium]
MVSTPQTTIDGPRTHGTTRTISASRGNTFAIYLTHQITRTSRGMLIWLVSLAAYGALIVAAFPSVKGTTDLESYPEALRDAFSLTTLDQIEPYLTGQILSYLPLVIAFIPIMLFSGALAGAEERGSLDVLLGTPLSRRELVLTTFLTGAFNLFVVLLGLAIGLWLTSLAVDAGLSIRKALAGSLVAWPIGLAFGSVALLGSAVMRQRSRVLGLAIGLMFAMYALYVLSKLVDSLDWLKWLSAFHYYGAAVEDGVYWLGVAVLLATTAVLTVLAVLGFERRDIYT